MYVLEFILGKGTGLVVHRSLVGQGVAWLNTYYIIYLGCVNSTTTVVQCELVGDSLMIPYFEGVEKPGDPNVNPILVLNCAL